MQKKIIESVEITSKIGKVAEFLLKNDTNQTRISQDLQAEQFSRYRNDHIQSYRDSCYAAQRFASGQNVSPNDSPLNRSTFSERNSPQAPIASIIGRARPRSPIEDVDCDESMDTPQNLPTAHVPGSDDYEAQRIMNELAELRRSFNLMMIDSSELVRNIRMIQPPGDDPSPPITQESTADRAINYAIMRNNCNHLALPGGRKYVMSRSTSVGINVTHKMSGLTILPGSPIHEISKPEAANEGLSSLPISENFNSSLIGHGGDSNQARPSISSDSAFGSQDSFSSQECAEPSENVYLGRRIVLRSRPDIGSIMEVENGPSEGECYFSIRGDDSISSQPLYSAHWN